MLKFKTIIFDLDGTLLKTDAYFLEAMKRTCKQNVLKQLADAEILKLIGKPSLTICRELFGGILEEEELHRIRMQLRQNESLLYDKEAQLYDGVIKMLSNLKEKGFTLGICTNGSKEYVDKFLRHFGLLNYFDIVKSRIEGLEKDQLMKQILDEIGVCSAIVVGDTLIDYEAAEKTGCISIGVSYGYGGEDYRSSDFTANHPEDIVPIVHKINHLYHDVAETILHNKKNKKPILVGINGVDTSGKSTFCKELRQYLKKLGFPCESISIDDFHNPSDIRNSELEPILSYIKHAFDLEKIEEELLKPIMLDGTVHKELLLLDLENDAFTQKKIYSINLDTIVLFEGVLLYREPINQYFDMRIYIDISFDEVLDRAVKRDRILFGDAVVERYSNKYIPIQKIYLNKYQPKEISDIVIDNNDYRSPVIIKNTFLRLKPLVKDCDEKSSSASKIKLTDIKEVHMPKLNQMMQDSQSRMMLGAIDLPRLDDYSGLNHISKAILEENEEFIGVVELFNISWKNRRGELSIEISPEMRGKGYGYISIKQILDMAFYEYGFQRIWLRVIETNTNAIKLYNKIGFIQEGICRNESLRHGKFVNQIQKSILAIEWIERGKYWYG